MLIQEDYFRNIFNTVREAILILDENMRVLSANRSFFTTFKVDAANTIGTLLYDLGNGQWNLPELRVLLEDILPKNDKVDDYEIEHIFESIGQKTMLLNACKIREKKNDLPIILLAIEDITERREIEKGLEKARKELEVSKLVEADETLKEEKMFIENALNALKDAFFVFDLEGRFLRWNKTMNTVTGYIDREIVLMKPTDFFLKDDIERVSGAIRAAVIEGSASVDAIVVAKDGRQIPYEFRIAQMRDYTGNLIGISGVGSDLMEHNKLEAQLRQSQKMEAVGILAGGIAHDFNNILYVIIGYGNIALTKIAKDDPQRGSIEHILEAGERAAQLTKSLLLFSRKQISERKPVDLNEIIRTVDKFLKRVIGEDVECRTSLFEEALPILGDAHQIEQVLMNLATNARDAMSMGGIFTIATEQVRLDEAYITIHGYGKPGIYGLITISDTGKGMDAVTREHIFEPFFTTKEAGKGTGLGLAIAYGIIKQHEGFINVYSEPGHGTSFKIYLPLISAGVKEEKKLVEERPRGGTETILLAEDDETVRTMTKAILEAFGYTVIAAVDGQDGVNKFKENKGRIKLLLFDIIMPKKSGQEAYDEIRAIQPDIKILFQSGYAPDLVRQKLLLEDTMPVVFKPVTPMMLLKQVREVLDQVK